MTRDGMVVINAIILPRSMISFFVSLTGFSSSDISSNFKNGNKNQRDLIKLFSLETGLD